MRKGGFVTQRTGADDGWRQLFYDCLNTLASIGLVVLAISCDAFTRGYFQKRKVSPTGVAVKRFYICD